MICIEWTGQKSYWLEEGVEVGDGRAEGLSATGDGRQAALSLTADIDDTGSSPLLEPDACLYHWKSSSWSFICRGLTVSECSDENRSPHQRCPYRGYKNRLWSQTDLNSNLSSTRESWLWTTQLIHFSLGFLLPGKKMWKWKSFSCVWLFVNPWSIKSMELFRPKYWSG